MSDAASLRAMANDMETEENLCITVHAAPCPEKIPPSTDEEVMALYEDLKPETRNLIESCTSETKLHRSMLTMRQAPTQKKRRVFETPLLFRDGVNVDEISTRHDDMALEDRLALLHAQIAHLECVLDEIATTLLAVRRSTS